jgi:hypothetical protein
MNVSFNATGTIVDSEYQAYLRRYDVKRTQNTGQIFRGNKDENNYLLDFSSPKDEVSEP